MSAAPVISKVVVTPVAFATRRCSTWSASTSRGRCARSSSSTPTPAWSASGETYADETHLARLDAVARALPGADPYDTHGLRRLVVDVLGKETGGAGASFGGMLDVSSAVDTVYSPFEVACLDLVAREAGRPVSDLLGGAVRDRVPFSGYMFYKWAGHPGQPDDEWGEALNPEQIVAQAKRLVEGWGFGSLKLKGGVFHPDEECAAIEALRDAFPDLPLRLDPNGAWTPETSVKVAERLAGVVEYLEDPTPGIEGMAQVSARTDVPLATNMCVIAFEHLKPAIAADAVQIVLSDHHLWGGLRRSALLGGITDTFGLGLSMHSNSHLGVSLAAMVHLAAATPNLTYACDTHYPWKTQDVVRPGVLDFGTARSRCRRVRAWAWSSIVTCSASCTSSTSAAACAAGRTPSTCVRSSRISRRTRRAGDPRW